jgi:hypothetical protein
MERWRDRAVVGIIVSSIVGRIIMIWLIRVKMWKRRNGVRVIV